MMFFFMQGWSKCQILCVDLRRIRLSVSHFQNYHMRIKQTSSVVYNFGILNVNVEKYTERKYTDIALDRRKEVKMAYNLSKDTYGCAAAIRHVLYGLKIT